MKKVKALITLVTLFLAPSLTNADRGAGYAEAVCPNIFLSNLTHLIEFERLLGVPEGARITSLYPRYVFNSGDIYTNFYAYIRSPTKEARIFSNGGRIEDPFLGDPANVNFSMKFIKMSATQEAIIPAIYGGKCTLIVNWETPIVLENTPIKGPEEIIVKKTEKYTVSVPKATTYFTTVSDPLICEIVGAKDDSTVFIKGLKLGQCKIKRDAWIASDPKVQVVTDELSVEVVLSEEAKRAAGVQAAINMLLLPEK